MSAIVLKDADGDQLRATGLTTTGSVLVACYAPRSPAVGPDRAHAVLLSGAQARDLAYFLLHAASEDCVTADTPAGEGGGDE